MNKGNELDDFANDKEIMKLRKEKAAHEQMINDSIEIVKSALNGRKCHRKSPVAFFLYKSLKKPTVASCFSGEWNGKHIYVARLRYFTAVAQPRLVNQGMDDYFFGIISLKEAYPHIIIKPEILALKIEDLFTKMDVDFKHARLFSFLYYVITKDKNALEFKFQSKELNRIARFLNAEIEFIGYECFFRVNRKAISLKEAERFVKLAKVLAEVF